MKKAVKEKAFEIVKLAMDFNERPTEREKTGDKPTFFVEFSGHCCNLTVGICSQGWTPGRDEYPREVTTVFLTDVTAEGELDKIVMKIKATIARWEASNAA